jgi:hypothetical protein
MRLTESLKAHYNVMPTDDCKIYPLIIKQYGKNTRVMNIHDTVYYCDDIHISMFEKYGDVHYKAAFGMLNKYPIIYVYDRHDSLVGFFYPLKSNHNVLLSFVDELQEICTTLWESA